MLTYLSIFFGGGLGSLTRYLIYNLVSYCSMPSWMGTVAVNIIGGTIIIYLREFFDEFPLVYQKFFKVGLLGGLTTFSTLSHDFFTLIRGGLYSQAFLALGLNVFFGIIIGIFLFK